MAARKASCARLVLCAQLLLPGLVPAVANAEGAVYKCRDAAGQTSYQDEPCPPGTEQPAPVLAPAPPYVPPSVISSASTPPQAMAGAPPESPLRLPPPPLPALFRCERYDGQETYVTEDPVPRVYQVPLWAVLPDHTRSNSGGLSTSRTPRGGGGNSMMGAYTTVQDRCRRMGRAELCAHWAQRAETVRQQLRTAFNDTRPGLEQEQAGLREGRSQHCGD